MAERFIDTSLLEDTANALRDKGVEGSIEYTEDGFADAIRSMEIKKPNYTWNLVSN